MGEAWTSKRTLTGEIKKTQNLAAPVAPRALAPPPLPPYDPTPPPTTTTNKRRPIIEKGKMTYVLYVYGPCSAVSVRTR